jgi:hypothetical protein
MHILTTTIIGIGTDSSCDAFGSMGRGRVVFHDRCYPQYKYIYTYLYIYICTYVYICTCMYVHIYIHMNLKVRIAVVMPSDQWGGEGLLGAGVAQGFLHGLPSDCCNTIGVCVSVCVCVFVHICIYIYIYVYIYIYTSVYIYIYIFINICMYYLQTAVTP